MDREQRKLMRVRGAGTRPLSQSHIPVFKVPSPKNHRTSPTKFNSKSPRRQLLRSPERIKIPKTQKSIVPAKPPKKIRNQSEQILENTPLRQSASFQVTPYTLDSVERRELQDIETEFQEDNDRIYTSEPFGIDLLKEDIRKANERKQKKKQQKENKIPHERIPPVEKTKKKPVLTRKKISEKGSAPPPTPPPKRISNKERKTQIVKSSKPFEDEYLYESSSEDNTSTSSSENEVVEDQEHQEEEQQSDEAAAPDSDFSDADADEVLYGLRKSSVIKISRIPTSSSRLTFIDVLIHYLKEAVPTYKDYEKDPELFKKFTQSVVFELEEILDTSLANNHLLSEIREINREKDDLRRQILEFTNSSNELNAEISKLRAEYRILKKNLNDVKEIDDYIDDLKSQHDNEGDEDNESDANAKLNDTSEQTTSFLMNVNKLNKVVDPNYGLFEKLKRVNKKLQTIDQLFNRKLPI